MTSMYRIYFPECTCDDDIKDIEKSIVDTVNNYGAISLSDIEDFGGVPRDIKLGVEYNGLDYGWTQKDVLSWIYWKYDDVHDIYYIELLPPKCLYKPEPSKLKGENEMFTKNSYVAPVAPVSKAKTEAEIEYEKKVAEADRELSEKKKEERREELKKEFEEAATMFKDLYDAYITAGFSEDKSWEICKMMLGKEMLPHA